MKKIFLTIGSLMLFFVLSQAEETEKGDFIGAKSTTMPSWFLNSFLDLNEDIDDLTDENKRLIVFVHQDGCPYCHRFVNKNLRDPKTVDIISKNFAIVEINMFGDKEVVDINDRTYTEKEFAINHKIQFTPTIMFFDENKKQILRLNGYINIPDFILALNYIKNKNEKVISYREYIQKEKSSKVKQSIKFKKDIFINSNNFSRNKNSKDVAIFFGNDSCIECTTILNDILQDPKIKQSINKLDVFQVNTKNTVSITTPNNKNMTIDSWLKKLNITNMPTIIFYSNSGQEVIRIEASFKTFHMRSIFEYVTSKAYKNEKEFQRYLTQRADAIREKGQDVNLLE